MIWWSLSNEFTIQFGFWIPLADNKKLVDKVQGTVSPIKLYGVGIAFKSKFLNTI